jgi:predicted AlkP superfamily phosphohydrolase/phosphomutase
VAVLVVSDHGFYGVHRAFRPQSYLRHPPPGIDPVTDAYSLETNASLISVPVRGRERGATRAPSDHDAVVDRVLERMRAATDPEGGAQPVLFGTRREDIYRGRYVDKAPDLILLARHPYYLINEAGDKDPFGTPGFSFSGHHDLRGILIASGPMFGRGRLEGRQGLMDLAPTVLYLAGVTVPGYMEGRVLEPIFRNPYLAAHPVRVDTTGARETGGTPEMIEAIPYVQ